MENGLKIKTKAPAKMAGGKRTERAGTGGGSEGRSEKAMGGSSGVKLKMDPNTNGRGVRMVRLSRSHWNTPDHPTQEKPSKKASKKAFKKSEKYASQGNRIRIAEAASCSFRVEHATGVQSAATRRKYPMIVCS
jgi:hypothetical protein